jgi:hypothetical protein
VIACSHSDLDAGDRDSTLGAITSARPDAIVHCAAWTNVDGCEDDPDHAYRDNALQAQLYSEMLAGKRAGPVAPPGGSYHNFGYAADVLPYDLSKQPALWALANQNPAYGVHALGAFDPPHIQMEGSLSDLRANPPALAGPIADLSGWLGGARSASPAAAVNAAPLPAPGAQARPVTPPPPPPAPGPIDPSIIARGGTSPPIPIPTTPGTTINSNPIASLGGKIEGLTTDLQKDFGKSDEAQKPPDIKPNIPPAPGARNVSPLLGGPGGIGQGSVSPVYAQRMAALNQPMTWGSAPPGQMYGTGFGVQAQPSVYGTSLMSNLQRLSDPMWMDQSYG